MRIPGLFAAAAMALFPVGAIAEELTVATWNLGNYSGADDTGCRPRRQRDYDQIRRVINAVDADVWLFQEVDSIGSLARVMDTTAWNFRMETRPDLINPGKCHGGVGEWTMQRTVFAAKKTIPLTGSKELSFLDVSGYGALRRGLSVTLQVRGRDIELLNIHLKAGCNEGSNGQACTQLFEQIPYLVAYAATQDGKGIPLIIGGDFNRSLADPGDAVMQTLAFNESLGLSIASKGQVSACSLSNGYPIDYQLTSISLNEMLGGIEAYEHAFDGPFENWPSDHCPNIVKYQFNG